MSSSEASRVEEKTEETEVEIVYRKEQPLKKAALWGCGSIVGVVVLLFTIGLLLGLSGHQGVRFDTGNLQKKAEKMIRGENPASTPEPTPTNEKEAKEYNPAPSTPPAAPTPSSKPNASREEIIKAGREAGRLYKEKGAGDPNAYWQGFNQAARGN